MKRCLASTLLMLYYLAGYSQATTTPATAPVPPATDSIAFYNQTRRAVISDPQQTEYAATIRADGKVMIVQTNSVTKANEFKLVQYSKDADERWSHPVPLDSVNNIQGAVLIGGPSLSYDGNSLYFFRDNDIYLSERKNQIWSRPVKLDTIINTTGYEGFPSISADGKSLYFVAQKAEGARSKELRKKDFFCTCIMKSTKGVNGKWSKPERLPAPINFECERAPKILADGKTLIFSSNRVGGKGGFDLYQSQLNAIGSWTDPTPLTFINSEMDDLSPSISAAGDVMYYTHGEKDIYSISIPHALRQFKNNIITGKVTEDENKKGLGVKIIVTNSFTAQTIMELDNNPTDGSYTAVLPVGASYNLQFVKEGYSSYVYSIDLSGEKSYKEYKQDVELFKTIKLTLHIHDKEIFEPVPTNVKIRAKGEKAFVYDGTNNGTTGLLMIDLPVGKDYEIQFDALSFKGVIEEFDAARLIVYKEYDKFIPLDPDKKSIMVNVADIQNNGKLNAKVIFKNKNREELIEVTGNQMVQLRAGDRYEIEVSSEEGYAFDSKTIDLNNPGAFGDAIDFRLQKLEMDAKLTLKDINFESNSDKLNDVSYSELARVIKMLTDNPSLIVEIDAHTDDIGSDIYNNVLSQKRAQSVVNYLKINSIMESRFVAKGFGEKMAKVPNTSEENRHINRRVELKIIGI